MKKIVLTGGPCSGKTTVQRALQEEFHNQVVLVPEVATLLLGGGFPIPGKDLPWSAEWQASFQAAVLPLQQSLEDTYVLVARNQGSKLVVCDRGILDGAAYTPGGVEEFCRRFGVNKAEALARYDAILHLESLATSSPDFYGKTGNDSRFEPLAEAQRLEHATRAVWGDHPRHLIIDGLRGFDVKMAEVLGIIRFLLAEKSTPVSLGARTNG
jgi:predicted ATPase